MPDFSSNLDPYTLIIALTLFSYASLMVLSLFGSAPIKGALILFYAIALVAELGRLAPLQDVVGVQHVSTWLRNLWPWAFLALSLIPLHWPPTRRWTWIVALVGAAAATILSLPLDRLAGLEIGAARRWTSHAGWFISAGLTALLAVQAKQTTSRPKRRNRISYWLLILGATLIGHTLTLATTRLAAHAGVVMLALTGWLIAYVIRNEKLIDLSTLVREGLGYLLVTMVTVMVYFVTITLVQTIFTFLPPAYNRLVGISVSAIALTVLYQPLHRLAQETVDRVIFDVGYEHLAALDGYSEHISSITDLQELTVKAVTIIGHAFGAKSGALLDIKTRGPNVELSVIPGMGIMERYATEWPIDHPLLNFFRETGVPITLQEIHRSAEFRSLAPKNQAWLDALGMDVFVPIKAFGELIGILTLGPQAFGDRYYRSDLNILHNLAKETSLVLRNAQRLYELSSMNLSMTQLNAELQRLDEAKASFLTIASHELKTPLTLIQGYANILVSLPPDELQNRAKIKHITEGISRGTERLRQIIDDMIDISRLDANAFTLHWKECRLGHVLGLAIDQLRPAAEQRAQTIKVSELDALPPFDGDSQRLHQAFRNIIENAIKFTPDGGHISIHARLLGGAQPDEQFIEVVIADTGIGIDPEDQERIFEKFYRVGNVALHSSSRVQFKGGGPGLGLAISKGIIEAHGGKIWAASEGHDEATYPGSEFHILLMVKSPDHRAEIVEQYQKKDEFDLL